MGQASTQFPFHTSNAIYTIELMPICLKLIVVVNLLSYRTDTMRTLLVTGHFNSLPKDTLALSIATVV
jgi:ABC-type polysaccharide/polyol phosphate export permease